MKRIKIRKSESEFWTIDSQASYFRYRLSNIKYDNVTSNIIIKNNILIAEEGAYFLRYVCSYKLLSLFLCNEKVFK